jgi:hypothetical protein
VRIVQKKKSRPGRSANAAKRQSKARSAKIDTPLDALLADAKRETLAGYLEAVRFMRRVLSTRRAGAVNLLRYRAAAALLRTASVAEPREREREGL